MNVKSMTGFGRGESESGGRSWNAELRCVNNRHLDIHIKLPRGYGMLEERLRKKIASMHQRGRVDLLLSVSGDFSDLLKVQVNSRLARGYQEGLLTLAGELGIDEQPSLQELAAYPDVLVLEQQSEDEEAAWQLVGDAVDMALADCLEMRSREGEAMAEDLTSRLDNFDEVVGQIEASVPALLEDRQKGLAERLAKILDRIQLDEQRLAQEVAILADKTDVTEEIVRLRSHIEQFRVFLSAAEPVGRKLDFLIQEFLREVNTMASKINDATIAHLTVDLKGELEKMREQVQNIE
ncbi:MAG: YicC family protein [Desulfobulbaceae bacterium]|uniref:YicC family protein n=1 Tax=Candidatus Desulfatifera sulfidica TaxID=2841691 RepID=A0A8J6NC32_9BACT|nr:YicC family protein [Candidatus Desulfatifera sulfidica]